MSASRAAGAAGRGPADPARARGRQPALRGAVRPALSRARLDGRAPASRDAPGDHRRPPRRAARGEELLHDAAVVGKVFWTGAIGRERSDDHVAPLARAQGLPPPPATLVGGRRDRARLRPRARSRRRVRADPESRARAEHRAVAEWIEASAAPRTTPRCSPTTGARRSSSSARQVTTTSSWSAPGWRYGRPAIGRSPSTLPGRGGVLRGCARALAGGHRAARPSVRLPSRSTGPTTRRASRMHSRPRETHCWRWATGARIRGGVVPRADLLGAG